MAMIELNQLIEIVKRQKITPEMKGVLNNVCFITLTEHHDIYSIFSYSEIEFLLKHTDISGFSKNYGYKWTALHWAEENKIVLSDSIKDYLLHHLDLNGTDNNGNTLLFKAISPKGYFTNLQIDYILHTINPSIENIFCETALDTYLYNNYNTLNSTQLTYLIEHTQYTLENPSNSTPLKNFIGGQATNTLNLITTAHIDLLLSHNLDWETHKTLDNVLIDNILIYSLKQKQEALFTQQQWEYIIDNSIYNIKEALIVMSFFSRVTNLSEQANNKLKEIEHLYDLMAEDHEFHLPDFKQFSPNLPLSLAKNISLNFSNVLIMKILHKTLTIIDEHFLLANNQNTKPILQKIKTMFFGDKKAAAIVVPYKEHKDYLFKSNTKQHNNQQQL